MSWTASTGFAWSWMRKWPDDAFRQKSQMSSPAVGAAHSSPMSSPDTPRGP